VITTKKNPGFKQLNLYTILKCMFTLNSQPSISIVSAVIYHLFSSTYIANNIQFYKQKEMIYVQPFFFYNSLILSSCSYSLSLSLFLFLSLLLVVTKWLYKHHYSTKTTYLTDKDAILHNFRLNISNVSTV